MVQRSKPLPRSRRKDFTGVIGKHDRARQISRRNDEVQNVSITMEDIDSSLDYFFNNVLKLTVLENNRNIKVPVLYGNPERWKSTQKDGYHKDEKGKIITPLIMYRRTNVNKNTNLPVNKVGRERYFHTFEKQYSTQNRYDKFSALFNKKPTKERYHVIVPDYVTINYECIAWTSYISQMNKILEELQFSEGKYWGDPDSFKFYTSIDSFDQNVDISTETERAVRMNFSLTLKGYLLPESSEKELMNTQKQFTNQQLIVQEGRKSDGRLWPPEDIELTKARKQSGAALGTRPGTLEQDVANEVLLYLDSDKYVTYHSSSVDNNEATAFFSGSSIQTPPSPFPAQTKGDFLFFVNGQYIEHDAITTFQNSGSSGFKFSVDTGSLGFSFESDDEIIAWGKFS